MNPNSKRYNRLSISFSPEMKETLVNSAHWFNKSISQMVTYILMLGLGNEEFQKLMEERKQEAIHRHALERLGNTSQLTTGTGAYDRSGL
jgi:hypothetical protein